MSAHDSAVPPASVQSYLDEVPTWRDGTPATAGAMTAMQKRIWLFASAGKFLEGMIVFMVGVALPLIIDEFGLSSAQSGVVTAAPLLGIMVGASALGGLSDRWGRRQMFLAETVLFTAFLVGVTVSTGFPMLVVCLIGMGLALGCDYPTAHTMISETMPTTIRGRGVLAAFGFQAVGALAGTLVGVIILGNRDELSDWRWMFGVAVVPSVLVIVGRLFVVQSPHWLLGTGRVDEAEYELKRLLARRPQYPTTVTLTRHDGSGSDATSTTDVTALFAGPGVARRSWPRSRGSSRTSGPTGSASSSRRSSPRRSGPPLRTTRPSAASSPTTCVAPKARSSSMPSCSSASCWRSTWSAGPAEYGCRSSVSSAVRSDW